MKLNLVITYKPIIGPDETAEAEPEPEQITISLPSQQQRL
jgi:hypothetical protein